MGHVLKPFQMAHVFFLLSDSFTRFVRGKQTRFVRGNQILLVSYAVNNTVSNTARSFWENIFLSGKTSRHARLVFFLSCHKPTQGGVSLRRSDRATVD